MKLANAYSAGFFFLAFFSGALAGAPVKVQDTAQSLIDKSVQFIEPLIINSVEQIRPLFPKRRVREDSGAEFSLEAYVSPVPSLSLRPGFGVITHTITHPFITMRDMTVTRFPSRNVLDPNNPFHQNKIVTDFYGSITNLPHNVSVYALTLDRAANKAKDFEDSVNSMLKQFITGKWKIQADRYNAKLERAELAERNSERGLLAQVMGPSAKEVAGLEIGNTEDQVLVGTLLLFDAKGKIVGTIDLIPFLNQSASSDAQAELVISAYKGWHSAPKVVFESKLSLTAKKATQAVILMGVGRYGKGATPSALESFFAIAEEEESTSDPKNSSKAGKALENFVSDEVAFYKDSRQEAVAIAKLRQLQEKDDTINQLVQQLGFLQHQQEMLIGMVRGVIAQVGDLSVDTHVLKYLTMKRIAEEDSHKSPSQQTLPSLKDKGCEIFLGGRYAGQESATDLTLMKWLVKEKVLTQGK